MTDAADEVDDPRWSPVPSWIIRADPRRRFNEIRLSSWILYSLFEFNVEASLCRSELATKCVHAEEESDRCQGERPENRRFRSYWGTGVAPLLLATVRLRAPRLCNHWKKKRQSRDETFNYWRFNQIVFVGSSTDSRFFFFFPFQAIIEGRWMSILTFCRRSETEIWKKKFWPVRSVRTCRDLRVTSCYWKPDPLVTRESWTLRKREKIGEYTCVGFEATPRRPMCNIFLKTSSLTWIETIAGKFKEYLSVTIIREYYYDSGEKIDTWILKVYNESNDFNADFESNSRGAIMICYGIR